MVMHYIRHRQGGGGVKDGVIDLLIYLRKLYILVIFWLEGESKNAKKQGRTEGMIPNETPWNWYF